jgi:tRNA (cmo5U34)-methyltransferase
MIDAARQRFAGDPRVSIRKIDLRTEYPAARASIILSVLTLQFVPIEHRMRVLSAARRSLAPGGALLLVEKILGANARFDDAFVRLYYALKGANGYSPDQIERKRLSLEGVLVPVTAAWNENLLRSAGFSEVECFWRWMNFAGWIAVAGEP